MMELGISDDYRKFNNGNPNIKCYLDYESFQKKLKANFGKSKTTDDSEIHFHKYSFLKKQQEILCSLTIAKTYKEQ